MLSPTFAREIVDSEESIAVYLGYPRITAEEKMAQTRRYDTKFDWTRNLSDKELLEMFKKHIQESKKLEQEAKDKGYTFIDTSYNREQSFQYFIDQYLEQKDSRLLYRTDKSYDKYER